MSVLGHFKYHIYEAKLEGNDDETEYIVTVTQSSLRQFSDPNVKPEILVRTYKDLRPARDAFETAIRASIAATSFTDVSLYEQH